MLDFTLHEKTITRAVEMAQKKGIIIPTLEEQREPERIPSFIQAGLKEVASGDDHPLNLFRISWKNNHGSPGGPFGDVNYREIPREFTGVSPRILALLGHHFPTHSPYAASAFASLVPRLVSGQFDPIRQQAAWFTRENYIRGGVYISRLLGCHPLLLCPRELSQGVIPFPGSKGPQQKMDICSGKKEPGKDIHIFNPYQDLWNHLWHYQVTGGAVEEVLAKIMEPGDRFAGFVASSDSPGILGAGDYLKEIFPNSFLAVSENLRCPTLLYNVDGMHPEHPFGGGVSLIQNLRHTDFVIGVDDGGIHSLLRLFHEEEGIQLLSQYSPYQDLSLLGPVSIGNLQAAIKVANYLELSREDILFTVFPDSPNGSLSNQWGREGLGSYSRDTALIHLHQYLLHLPPHPVWELGYYERQRIHNRKGCRGAEEMPIDAEELKAQWYNYGEYWGQIHSQGMVLDEWIRDFNRQTGLFKKAPVGPSYG